MTKEQAKETLDQVEVIAEQWTEESTKGRKLGVSMAEEFFYGNPRQDIIDNLWIQLNESNLREASLQLQTVQLAPPFMKVEGAEIALEAMVSRQRIVMKAAEVYWETFKKLPPLIESEVNREEIEALTR